MLTLLAVAAMVPMSCADPPAKPVPDATVVNDKLPAPSVLNT